MKKSGVNTKFIIILIVLFGFSFIVTAQVIGNTQVIDLAEKARDFFIEATKGNIIGQTTSNKFGHNLGVGTIIEDIQSQGGTLTFLQSAELITLSSTDAADTVAGVNARSVEIIGLDENFTEISEIVNLSGTTEVNTTNKFIRINRMIVNEVGTYGVSNAGIITGISAITRTTQIEIPLGSGQSKTTHFTVPLGQNVIITTIQISMDTGKTINVELRIRENADDITAPMNSIRMIRDWRGLDTPFQSVAKANLKMNEMTDIWFEAQVTTGSAEVEVNYDMLQYAIGS